MAIPPDAISRYVEKDAPKAIRKLLKSADKDDILDPRYPYRERLDDDDYEDAYDGLPARARQDAGLAARRPASASSSSSRAATPPARAARSRRSPRT